MQQSFVTFSTSVDQKITKLQGAVQTSLQEGFHNMQQELVAVTSTLNTLQGKVDLQEEKLFNATQQSGRHQEALESNALKIDQLELQVEKKDTFSRRNNIRFMNIPELAESSAPDLKEFIASLVVKWIKPDLEVKEIVSDIQRVHRVPPYSDSRKLQKPRHIKVNFLTFSLKEVILKAAQEKYTITTEGFTFFLLPDESPAASRRRWSLKQLMAPLKELGAEVQYLKSIKLKVKRNGKWQLLQTEREVKLLIAELEKEKGKVDSIGL